MRLLHAMPNWGLCPQTPRIYRFFTARMDRSDLFQGTGITCPPPFRLLNRSLRLLPSRALSRPVQVCPGWMTSTSPCNNFLANGDKPLNFLSHSRGSLQLAPRVPLLCFTVSLCLCFYRVLVGSFLLFFCAAALGGCRAFRLRLGRGVGGGAGGDRFRG